MAEITIASEKHVQGLADLYHRVYKGNYPLKDFTEPVLIEKQIKSKNIWLIALVDDEVVGSIVGIPSEWNGSVEIGRAVVAKEYTNNSIASKLAAKIVETVFQEYDLSWFTIRNSIINSLGCREGFTNVGYVAPHVVENREVHLFSYQMNDNAKSERIIPDFGSPVYRMKGVVDIQENMGFLDSTKGSYPDRIIVGDNSNENNNSSWSGFLHPNDKAFYLSSIGDDFFLADYFQIFVLADKAKEIELLRRFNFEISAFLPGWYKERNHRYDCVCLMNTVDKVYNDDKKILGIIKNFKKGFVG